ncbi:MAG: alpha/beta hydrolase, partial [Myxococcota bacterium]
MSDPVASRPVPPMIRLARPAIRAFGAVSRLRRRPAPPPVPPVEEAYGPHPRERIHYLAPKPGVPVRGAILYFHGGGWIIGAKETYTPFLAFLAEAGHPVFNVGYPLAPENPHPGILRSLFRALDWIAARHPEFAGYHTMGDSAGGNLCTMLGLLSQDPGLVKDVEPARTEGLPLSCHSIVSIYGVLDRLTWIEDGFPGASTMLELYGGEAAFAAEVGPALAITPLDLDFATAPPTLLTVGTEDPLLRSSRLFAERLGAGPGKVSLREYPGEPHGFFNFGTSEAAARMNADILEFLA